MFAFENWHSALEMKLYFQRFIHHIAGLPDFSALKFTKYNQYDSLILPMQKYLEEAGVDFQFNTEVTNVIFEIKDGKKVAKTIEWARSTSLSVAGGGMTRTVGASQAAGVRSAQASRTTQRSHFGATCTEVID